MINKTFQNKKVIVTGHTGFKGSWLTAWLVTLGAKVIGISKSIPTKPSHFEKLRLKDKIEHYEIDIRDLNKLKRIINLKKPDFVFHLAAQALVKESYNNPTNTIETNTIGTMNVLESLRLMKSKKVCTAVIVTSDKVYKNLEIKRGYTENDMLGGKDPYSSSKASAEILISSYINSFFPIERTNVFISIARAGNVIGGGDWSKNRLIPDCIKSWSKNKKVLLRNPRSTRPWQHVLEAIWGYLLLACKLNKTKKLHGESFNFGPDYYSSHNVLKVVKKMKEHWGNISWKVKKSSKDKFFESNLLKLNSNKAKKILGWKCKMNLSLTLKMVTEWYKYFYINNEKNASMTFTQIQEYQEILQKK